MPAAAAREHYIVPSLGPWDRRLGECRPTYGKSNASEACRPNAFGREVCTRRTTQVRCNAFEVDVDKSHTVRRSHRDGRRNMNALGQSWHSILSALVSFLQALNGRRRVLGESIRFGIASRLAVAFIGVAVLVLAANLIVEQGVLIERTTQISRTTALPVVSPTPPATAPPTTVEPPPPKITPERREITSDTLTSALDRFGRSVQDRIKANTEQSAAEYQQNAADLDRASGAFVAQAVSISGKPFGKLTSAVNAYRGHGDDLVLMADNRRALLISYSTSFEGLNAHVNASLDGAWTIFGRVVARQSLLLLSAELDGLRRSSVALGSAESEEAPEIAPLLNSEHAAEKTLEANERGFRRSQGDQWYASMRDDLAHLVAVRESLLQLNEQVHVRIQELIKEATSVMAMIPGKVEARVIVAAPAKRSLPAAVSTIRAADMPSLLSLIHI